ncbi:hypothetical protein D3C71_1232100 [compost metagenome]
MLDGARDARGDVQLRRDDLAGLAHLPVVRGVACIHGGAAGAQARVELVGQRRHHFVELLGAAQGTATRDDDLGGGQFGAVALRDFTAHEGALAAVGDAFSRFNGGAAAGGGCGVEAGRAHGDHLGGVGALHGGDGVAGVDRALERIRTVDLGDVADLSHVELGGHARSDVLAVGGRGEQDVAVVAGDRQHLRCDVLGEVLGQRCAVGSDHLGHAGDLRGGLGGFGGVGTGHEDVDVATASQGCSHGVEGGRLDAGVVVFGNDECGHVRFFLRSLWLRS